MAATILRLLRLLREGSRGGASGVFVIRIAAAGFAYAGQVLAARLRGFDAYGIFATVWVWTALIGHTLTLGLAQSACRFLPEDQARGDGDHARGFLRAGAFVTGGIALSAGGLGLALLRLEPDLLAAPYRTPAMIAAAILPIFAMQDYCEGVARSQNWLGLAIAPPYLVRQSAMMAFMVAACLLGAPPLAETAMACMCAAALVASAAILCLILVPLWGPLGAAIAMATAATARAAALSLAAKALHRLPTPVWAAAAA